MNAERKGSLKEGNIFDWFSDAQTLQATFKEYDVNGDGFLDWNSGEIMNYIKAVFEMYDIEMPELADTQWYLLYKEFDEDDRYKLTMEQTMNMAALVHEKHVTPGMDFAHALLPQSKSSV